MIKNKENLMLLKSAFLDFEKCVELNFKLFDCYYRMGDIKLRLEELDDALIYFNKAIENFNPEVDDIKILERIKFIINN